MASALKSDQNVVIKPVVQRIFIALIVVAFAAQMGEILYWIIRQYPSNHNLSGFLSVALSTLILPILFVVIAYFFVPRRSRWSRLFTSLFLTIMGMGVIQLIAQAANHVYVRLLSPENSYWQFILYQAISDLIATIFYVGILVYLARTKNL